MNEQKYRRDQLLAVILDSCAFSHPVENYANTVVFWGLENVRRTPRARATFGVDEARYITGGGKRISGRKD